MNQYVCDIRSIWIEFDRLFTLSFKFFIHCNFFYTHTLQNIEKLVLHQKSEEIFATDYLARLVTTTNIHYLYLEAKKKKDAAWISIHVNVMSSDTLRACFNAHPHTPWLLELLYLSLIRIQLWYITGLRAISWGGGKMTDIFAVL